MEGRNAEGSWGGLVCYQICYQQCPGVCKPSITWPQQPQPSPAAVLEVKVQHANTAVHGLNSLLRTKAEFLRIPDFLPGESPLALSGGIVAGQDFEQGVHRSESPGILAGWGSRALQGGFPFLLKLPGSPGKEVRGKRKDGRAGNGFLLLRGRCAE